MEFHVQGIPNWDCYIGRCQERSNDDQECSFCLCVGGYTSVGTILQLIEIKCQSNCGQSLQFFFNGIIAANIVFVVVFNTGWFSLGLDESFGIEPFIEFNVPIFARIDMSIDSFVQ